MKRALERYGTQFLDYLGLRIKIPKIDSAGVTPFPVVVTRLDYDAVPVGGSYWFNGQLQKRYWAAPTPTPETPEPIVEFPTKRAVDMEDAASRLTYQVRFKKNSRKNFGRAELRSKSQSSLVVASSPSCIPGSRFEHEDQNNSYIQVRGEKRTIFMVGRP
jgi:hypothetical protein